MEGGREGIAGEESEGEGRGGRETNTEENIGSIGESIPDGWRPEASPPAGRNPEAKASVEVRGLPSRRAKLCLCLSLTQKYSNCNSSIHNNCVFQSSSRAKLLYSCFFLSNKTCVYGFPKWSVLILHLPQ